MFFAFVFLHNYVFMSCGQDGPVYGPVKALRRTLKKQDTYTALRRYIGYDASSGSIIC